VRRIQLVAGEDGVLDRLSVRLREFSGARAVRLSDSGCARIAEHAHGWPVLSLFVVGSYENSSELGMTRVSRPSAMFYQAGERHSNIVGNLGLEQIDLEFDLSWLGLKPKSSWLPVVNWEGGPAGLRARKLAKLWSDPLAREGDLAAATREFLIRSFDEPSVRGPAWLEDAQRLVEKPSMASARRIARELDLHPGWFAEAYRAAMGEGVGETVRRRRVEAAVHMLTSSNEPAAQVAAAAGFCDQSHMIHAFQAVLGRTPGQVRRERTRSGSDVTLF
jgi:AraC family transcriptional regulator